MSTGDMLYALALFFSVVIALGAGVLLFIGIMSIVIWLRTRRKNMGYDEKI